MDSLREIDALPDAAILPDKVACKVMGVSWDSLRRNNPVPPIRLSAHRLGRRLGDIRALGAPAPERKSARK